MQAAQIARHGLKCTLLTRRLLGDWEAALVGYDEATYDLKTMLEV